MRFPSGVRKALDLYRDKIDAVAGGWVDWESPLGCGSYGCVFPLWDSSPEQEMYAGVPTAKKLDRVLKISTDPTEGPVVSAIMKTGLDKRLNGLARWHGIWRIPEPIQKGPRGTGWVIVREEVRPFNGIRDFSWSSKEEWADQLRFYNEYARKAIKAKTEQGEARNWEKAEEKIAALYNEPGTYYVAEAIDALKREGITLADVHHGNLGFRIHPTENQELQQVWWNDQKERAPLLIFDPGHSSAPEGIQVEALWQLSGAANPWLEDEKRKIETL